MAVKKSGLGKGLEALFNENQLTKEEERKLKAGEEIFTQKTTPFDVY